MIVELPDDIVGVVFTEQQVKEVIAITLYKMEKINSVLGGKIIGASELEFQKILGKYGQTVNYDSMDLFKDMEALKDL